MVPFWVTFSWATLWKKFLFVLNKTGPPKSTENILFSSCMVQSFCCCHHWFGPSKIAPSTVRIDKTQKSGHLVTIFCWGEAMPIPAHILLFCFYFRKASNASLHLQKANIPSVCVHCITEEFSLPCKWNPPKHNKQWTHADEILGHNMSSFIYIWSLVESIAQENLRVGNKTSISEKGRRQERSWFSNFWHYCTKPGKTWQY